MLLLRAHGALPTLSDEPRVRDRDARALPVPRARPRRARGRQPPSGQDARRAGGATDHATDIVAAGAGG